MSALIALAAEVLLGGTAWLLTLRTPADDLRGRRLAALSILLVAMFVMAGQVASLEGVQP